MGGRTNQGWETHRVNIETVGVYCVWDFMGGRTNQGWETHGVNIEQWEFIVSVISWEGEPIRGGRHTGE